MTEPGTVLGLDYGTVRVGVAGSDPERRTAFPIAVVAVDDEVWDRLQTIVDERGAQLLVIGLPVGLSGHEGPAARAARDFGAELSRRTGVEVCFADERFTTRSAEEMLIGSNVKRRKRRTVIDAVAAAVMLQNFLDTRPDDITSVP